MDTTVDGAVAHRFERQHGLVTAAQARQAGLTRSAIRHRVAAGRWVRRQPGVYQLVGTASTWESRLLARVLAAGPEALATHRSSAALTLDRGPPPARARRPNGRPFPLN